MIGKFFRPCPAFQSGTTKKTGWGNPPDSDPPEGLDWDMWLGPAQKRPFNLNRWGVKTATFPTFRYFWDYAGGAMTDWGVHLIDPLHQCFDEVMPTSVTALGSKFYVADNSETLDTMQATFQYPSHLSSYESRTCNPLPMFGLNQDAGTTIHGTEATIFVSRSGCWLIPNPKSTLQPQTWQNDKTMQQMNLPHWQHLADCIRSRNKPTSEIETCVRSSTTCILANLSMRFGARLDWQETDWTVKQESVQPSLQAKYRSPWRLEV